MLQLFSWLVLKNILHKYEQLLQLSHYVVERTFVEADLR
jgi:hypothetical protein